MYMSYRERVARVARCRSRPFPRILGDTDAVPNRGPFSADLLPPAVFAATRAQDCCDVIHPRRRDVLLLAPLLEFALDVDRVAPDVRIEVEHLVAEPPDDVLGLAVLARGGEHSGGRVEPFAVEPDGPVD